MKVLTLARDLKRRKARERRSLFVAEGVRAVEELLRSPLRVAGALTSEVLHENPRGEALIAALAERNVECDEVNAREFRTAADTEHPQGILAIAEVPAHSLEKLAPAALRRMLVLDAIQDPGNVGTLVRTGAALGAGAVVALPGTADPWNAKAVRSAAGAHFHVPVIAVTAGALVAFLRNHGIVLWGTAADGDAIADVAPPVRVALALGNEGAGLSKEVREAADRVVSLPMSAGIESLNVAVAAGIALYVLGK